MDDRGLAMRKRGLGRLGGCITFEDMTRTMHGIRLNDRRFFEGIEKKTIKYFFRSERSFYS